MKPLHPFEDWQISAYASGDLDPGERDLLAAHLASCPDCTQRLEEFRLVAASLAELPKPSPSRDLWPGISTRISPALAAVPGGHPFEEWELSAALDGDLEPAILARLNAHLAECAPCRARQDDLRGMVEALGSMPAMEPSPFLWTRIRANLGEGSHRGLGAFGYWLPTGLAAAAALVVVLLTTQQHRPQLQTPSAGPVPVAHVEPPAQTPAASNVAAAEPSRPLKSSAGRPETPAPNETPARPSGAGTSPTELASTGGGGGTAQDGAVGVDPDPTITAGIRAHLDELDATINDTQRNLALNPGNERVQAAAWSAYMAKVEYLRSILTRTPSTARNRSSYGPSGATGRSAA